MLSCVVVAFRPGFAARATPVTKSARQGPVRTTARVAIARAGCGGRRAGGGPARCTATLPGEIGTTWTPLYWLRSKEEGPRMRSVVRPRRPIVLAAAVVAIEGVGLSIWEFANAFGPPAAGITGTVVARAIAATAFVVGPTAGWQIQQQRRWAYRVGLTLTSLVVAGLAGGGGGGGRGISG